MKKVPTQTKKEYTFDAEGKILGRIASEIAKVLQGKDTAAYRKRNLAPVHIVVKHCDKIKVTGNKLDEKMYHKYSGYPGGLRSTPLKELLIKHPEAALKEAIYGMLPKNRLRRSMIKNVVFEQ